MQETHEVDLTTFNELRDDAMKRLYSGSVRNVTPGFDFRRGMTLEVDGVLIAVCPEPTGTKDPTSDEITQAGALKAAVRHVRREVNETLDGIEQRLEKGVELSCIACGLMRNLTNADTPCAMTKDGMHRLPNEVRLKEPA